LDKQEEHLWLSKDISVTDLLTLCNPYPDEDMVSFRVSTDVNGTTRNKMINNEPGFLLPLNSQ